MGKLTQEQFKNIYLYDKIAQKDQFDHQDFSEVLLRIIKDNTSEDKDLTPFNIGIFGRWGVGKSTVVNLFKELIEDLNKENKQKKYIFIDFTVWKYSSEALKRKFIFSIGKKLLGQKKLDELNTEVRGQKTLSFPLLYNPGALTEQLKKWKANIAWDVFKACLVFYVVIILVAFFLNYKYGVPKLINFADFFDLLLFFSICQIPTFLAYLWKSINKANISIAFDRYDTDEQFEEKFIEVVQESKDKIKIIFIDDLDRCPDDKVIETLETIKTYLDVKTCIFLIACADDVVKRVVEAKRKELCKDGDGADYLNKFFQYTIRIPPFIHQNMRDYAKNILECQNSSLLKLNDIEDILDILIHNEVFNPRKVILLINGFATDFEIALKREESVSSKLREGDVTSKLPQLAVFTVIKTDYPRIFDLLVSDNELLKYILSIEEGKTDFLEEYHKRILGEIYYSTKSSETGEIILDPKRYKINYERECEKFISFLKGVMNHIKDIDNYSPFIYLDADKSSYVLTSDYLKKLCEYVRKELVDEVREMFKELKTEQEKQNRIENVVNILCNILRGDREKERGLKTFFEIVVDYMPENIEFRKHVAGKVMNEFSAFMKNDSWLKKFNLEGIVFTLQYEKSATTKESVIGIFVDTLEKTTEKELGVELLNAVFHYEALVRNNASITKIRNVLNRRKPIADASQNTLISFPLDEICSFINNLVENGKAIEKLFSEGIVEEVCGALKELDKPGKEKTTEEGQEYEVLRKTFNILDEVLLSLDKNIKRRISNFVALIPTATYYYEIIDKLPPIISRIPQDALLLLLDTLVKKVESVESEGFEKLLSLINDISLKILVRPLKEFNTLADSFSKIMIEKYNLEEFQITEKYLVNFCDKRFSDEDLNSILSQLNGKLKVYEGFDITQKICKFMLNNQTILLPQARERLFDTFINEIYEIRNYDKQKFPNNEGIKFWKSVANEIINLVDNKEKLILSIAPAHCINASVDALTLEQKSILVDILKIEFNKYSKVAKEKLLDVFVSYLTVNIKEKISWGLAQIYTLSEELDLSDLEPQLNQNLFTSLTTIVKSLDDNLERTKALQLLLKEEKAVRSLGESQLEIMLNEVELQFENDRNQALALQGFLSEFTYFKPEKQILLCGKFLGSSVYSKDNSKKLIQAIVSDFSAIVDETTTPAIQSETIETNPESEIGQVQDLMSSKEEYIERFIVGVNLDKIAWEFFADLFLAFIPSINVAMRKNLGQVSIKNIKTKEESDNVRRNRFTVINTLKSFNALNEAEVRGLFTHLFSSEDEGKVSLACDFFQEYYRDVRLMKEHKRRYSIDIEDAIKRFEGDEHLKVRLMEIKNLV